MDRIAFVWLVKLEFPDGDVRLTSGGPMTFAAEEYFVRDDVYGTIGEVEALSEGVGEEVPVVELVLLPPGTTAPGDLVQPGIQASRARGWVGVYDPALGTLIGTPDLQFDGQVDQCTIEQGKGVYALRITIVSRIARFLERNIGNSLNPVWHKSIWPGETGHDNATGLGRNIAWGVEAPKPGVAMATGGTSAASGDFGVSGGVGLGFDGGKLDALYF